MPRYRFEGTWETVLHGLRHNIEAVLHRADGHEQPDGSTIVIQPGDELETKEPFPHPQLVNVATGEPDVAGAEPEAAETPATPPRKAAAKKAAASRRKPASGEQAPADTPPSDTAVSEE